MHHAASSIVGRNREPMRAHPHWPCRSRARSVPGTGAVDRAPAGNVGHRYSRPTEEEMAIDTFMAYVGVYHRVGRRGRLPGVKDLHTEAGLIDAYDAAVIERRDERQDQDRQEARDADAGRRRARRRRRAGHRPGRRAVPVRRDRRRAARRRPPPAARSSARSPVTRRRA